MNNIWRQTFEIHSKTDGYASRIEKAMRIINVACRRKMYCAFSGGKDSTVMVHLALRVVPDVMVLHWDYGRYYVPLKFHDEIIAIVKGLNVKNFRLETSDKYDKLKRRAINVLGEDYLGKLIPKIRREGYEGVFVGLRAEESCKRTVRIKQGGAYGGIKEYYPVGHLTWMDIWAYIVSNDLPYLSHYDRYAELYGYDKVRFTTFFDSEFDKFGCRNVDGILNWRFRNESP